ncbi:hypothetical protein [Actinoplanes sp. L3-i22]|uniref:hypothetical protein n=1 Tax=Actinoplanes sp. L3-i22 TaxID=2836373 RepID=UPI001C752296|nr:hypothetical protein [Actinoplanes sp. L3-i22]BCY11012.1 hypothetical protein L3i22_061000 [Actinoplanes sp. L3-i22]
MEFTQAARAVIEDLKAGNELALAAAVALALRAWRTLAAGDPTAWDLFGLDVLAVQQMLYVQVQVEVQADPPHDDGPTRALLQQLVGQLADHHAQRAATGTDSLDERLEHEAGSIQLRRALAVLG